MGKLHICTLTPDQDILEGIHQYLMDKTWKGALIVGAVGSIYDVTVGNPGTLSQDRNQPPQIIATTVNRPCEIISLTGEINRLEDISMGLPDHLKSTPSGYLVHIHLSCSHDEGVVLGGGIHKAKVLRAANIYMMELE